MGHHRPQTLVARTLEAALSLLLLAVIPAALLLGRGAIAGASAQSLSGVGLAAGVVSALTPVELTVAAANALDAAHRKGGGGITFQIVQTATLHAKPGGPKVDVPAPNGRGSLGLADEYEVGSTIERGIYTPDGFWMEMRAGPAKGDKPDWDHGTYEFGAIVKNDKTYRNDGQGWYATDSPPGIGLDPATSALLPTLLRNATNPGDAGIGDVGGLPARKVTAGAKVADAPGILAVDAKAFTAINGPVTFAFDALGRVVQLQVVTQNTNEQRFDLLVDTVMTFGYPLTADPIPDPKPVWVPPATPAPKG